MTIYKTLTQNRTVMVSLLQYPKLSSFLVLASFLGTTRGNPIWCYDFTVSWNQSIFQSGSEAEKENPGCYSQCFHLVNSTVPSVPAVLVIKYIYGQYI